MTSDFKTEHERSSRRQPPNKVVSLAPKLPRPSQREKSFFQQITTPPRRLTLGLLLTLVAFATLLGLSSMVVIDMPNWVLWLTTGQQHSALYSLQLPMAILIACVFGPRYGTVVCASVMVAMLLGLPLFANGGGPLYWMNPGFGYYVGLCLVPILINKELKKGFKGHGWFRGRSFYILLSALLAVVVTHGCGVVGLGVQTLLGVRDFPHSLQYFMQLTLNNIQTDIILAMAAASLTRWVRSMLFIVAY